MAAEVREVNLAPLIRRSHEFDGIHCCKDGW